MRECNEKQTRDWQVIACSSKSKHAVACNCNMDCGCSTKLHKSRHQKSSLTSIAEWQYWLARFYQAASIPCNNLVAAIPSARHSCNICDLKHFLFLASKATSLHMLGLSSKLLFTLTALAVSHTGGSHPMEKHILQSICPNQTAQCLIVI